VPVGPKKSLTEFAMWVAGMPSECEPATIAIYHRAVIAKTFPLSEIVAAHRYLESNAQIGKIVVTV
jgi:NADPH:quinone reductase-like Zn-dependent oxidoreductase